MRKIPDTDVITRMMFRLLPLQVLLAAVGAVNGIVSSYFASNYVGVEAMSAVGLYGPISTLVGALCTVLLGGSTILCGRYMGRNEPGKLRNIFSLDLIITGLAALLFTAVFIVLSLNDLTGFLVRDAAVRPLFNRYLLGQSIGLVPFLIGSQLPSFLEIENKGRLSVIATLVCIAVNVLLNYLFVKVLRLEAFGLALASSLGMWAFCGVQMAYFLGDKSFLHVRFNSLAWRDCGEIFTIGVPGALSSVYLAVRGLLLNWMIQAAVGTVGISASAGADNLLNIFWAIPSGMMAVSRLIISVSIGEEDRDSLVGVMRGMLRYYVPLITAVSVILSLLAEPMARILFRDPSQPVYMMTVRGLRILPFAMPFGAVSMHFSCYAQAIGKKLLVRLLAFLDGFLNVVLFVYLFIRPLGIDSVYIGNVFSGVLIVLFIIAHARIKKKHFPRTVDDMMVIPEDFGVPEDDAMEASVHSMEEVVGVSQRVQSFCLDKGIDARRAFMASLATEEMAGNIVEHGFGRDRKMHSVDVRVVYKNDGLILRLKDDCIPFDPAEREKHLDDKDLSKNIGIRMVFGIAGDIRYQNDLGLNSLSVRF